MSESMSIVSGFPAGLTPCQNVVKSDNYQDTIDFLYQSPPITERIVYT